MTKPLAETDDFTRLVNGYAETSAGLPEPAVEPVPAETPEGNPSTSGERIAAKRALYEEYLKAEGYRHQVDEDGDFAIRRESRWLVLFASDDDPDYFRFALPNIWECSSEREAHLALETANEMNRSCKVVKFIVVDRWIWANIEQYFRPLENFRGPFDRLADLLCETAGDFRRRMRQALAPEPPAQSEGTRQLELLCDDCSAEGEVERCDGKADGP